MIKSVLADERPTVVDMTVFQDQKVGEELAGEVGSVEANHSSWEF